MVYLMAPGKKSSLVEAVRKARLCTSSLKAFTELKIKKVVFPLMRGWQRYVLLEKILNSLPCSFCEVLTDRVMCC